MKHIFKPIVFIWLVFGLNVNAGQMNYLPQEYFGFENGTTSFSLQHNSWSISTEKVASGNYSLKFFSADSLAGDQKAHAGKGGAISLKAGTYTLKMKVWKESNATIKGVNFVIKNPKWMKISLSLDTINAGEWVEVSKQIAIEQEVIESGSMLIIGRNHVGKGTMYIDDIEILGEAEVVETEDTIPFTSSIVTNHLNVLSIPGGRYEMKLDVFLPDSSNISKFYTQIQSPYKSNCWRLDSLIRGQWNELSQELYLPEDVEDSPFKIFFSNHPEFGGGSGSVNIDNIRFVLKSGLGLDDKHLMDFNVYPNPARSQLNVSTESDGIYKLYGINGIIVSKGNLVAPYFTIPVNHLKAGVYILQIKSKDRTGVKQVLIQK